MVYKRLCQSLQVERTVLYDGGPPARRLRAGYAIGGRHTPSRNFLIDTMPFPQLVFATMKSALILVVGRRVGKAV
jgi:hypothetical protein